MANTISNSFITQWNSEVHMIYQQKGALLRPAVRTVTGVTGSTHKFHTLAAVAANQKSRGADVTGLEPAHDVVTATLADWYAPLYLDSLDQIKTNADFRREFVQTSAAALGRKTDELIVAALDAATPVDTIACASGLTAAKVLEAKKVLDENDVDPNNRFLVVSPAAMEDLMTDSGLLGAETLVVRQLNTGEITTGFGFNWIVSNRLTATTGVRACYAVDKMAVGLAIGQDLKTEVNYIPEKVSWLINSYLSMGAVAIDAKGIVQLNVTE